MRGGGSEGEGVCPRLKHRDRRLQSPTPAATNTRPMERSPATVFETPAARGARDFGYFGFFYAWRFS